MQVSGKIGSNLSRLQPVEFLVEPSAHYMSLPKELFDSIVTGPIHRELVTDFTGRLVEADIGLVAIEVMRRTGATLAARRDVLVPVLGRLALGGLGLSVDPKAGRLVKEIYPVPTFGAVPAVN